MVGDFVYGDNKILSCPGGRTIVFNEGCNTAFRIAGPIKIFKPHNSLGKVLLSSLRRRTTA